MTTLERETDRAIAAENRRFLADPQAVADARAEGELYRRRIEGVCRTYAPSEDYGSICADCGTGAEKHRNFNPQGGRW